MEQRKLQEVGGGTYTVSVPKEWAEAQSLSAGSTVHLDTHVDGSLLVRTERTDGDGATAARVEVDGRDAAAVRTELAGAHAAGFDTVTVEGAEPFTEDERHAVTEATRGLIGLETVEEGERSVTVRNLLDASEFSVRQSVVQLQFVALSALRRATSALVAGEADTVEQLRERAAEAERLWDVISRRFNRSLSSFEELDQLGLTRPELFDYHATADELGEIADGSVGVARMAASISGRLPADVAEAVRELSGTVLAVAEDAVTAALADDRAGAHDVLDRCDGVATEVDALDRRLSEGELMEDCPADRTALLRALDALARILGNVRDIAAVAVRSARRSVPQ
jgi:phosphate uptake regulator